jgi:hypothetical protein
VGREAARRADSARNGGGGADWLTLSRARPWPGQPRAAAPAR